MRYYLRQRADRCVTKSQPTSSHERKDINNVTHTHLLHLTQPSVHQRHVRRRRPVQKASLSERAPLLVVFHAKTNARRPHRTRCGRWCTRAKCNCPQRPKLLLCDCGCVQRRWQICFWRCCSPEVCECCNYWVLRTSSLSSREMIVTKYSKYRDRRWN